MTESHTQFVGSIPEIYDTHLGPVLFDFSARDLAERVAAVSGSDNRLLEIACGTGISTEYLRRHLPDEIHITATDLNEAMLDHARSKRGDLANVEFRTADALALPFDDESFDSVVCQYGIMFFPDKAKGIGEMTRVLKPGGWLVLNVWDSLEKNQAALIARDKIASFFSSDPPTFLQIPFSCHAIDPIKQLFEDAGFSELDIHVVAETVTCDDALSLARGFTEGNPGIHEIRERAEADPGAIVAALAEDLRRAFGPEPLQLPFQEIVFLAQKMKP